MYIYIYIDTYIDLRKKRCAVSVFLNQCGHATEFLRSLYKDSLSFGARRARSAQLTVP